MVLVTKKVFSVTVVYNKHCQILYLIMILKRLSEVCFNRV